MKTRNERRCKTCGKVTRSVFNLCGGCERIKAVSESNRPHGYNTPAQSTTKEHSGFTPGPWKVGQGTNGLYIRGNERPYKDGLVGEYVCTIPDRWMTEHKEGELAPPRF